MMSGVGDGADCGASDCAAVCGLVYVAVSTVVGFMAATTRADGIIARAHASTMGHPRITVIAVTIAADAGG